MTDTHSHLYLDEFSDGGVHAVERALEAGVSRIIFPNVDLATIEPMKALHARFPDNTFMAMALHPTEVSDTWLNTMDIIVGELQLDKPGYIAVGETGIDLYWDKTFRDKQMQVFEQHVRLAESRSLPLIIHCREALDETLEVLEGYSGKVGGVFHSFGGTRADVERIRRVAGDFYFGINGIVTFRNCDVRNSLPAIGMDRLLLETDSPYLAPVPHRGKRNESAYLIHTAAFVAQALDTGPSTLEAATDANASRLFAI